LVHQTPCGLRRPGSAKTFAKMSDSFPLLHRHLQDALHRGGRAPCPPVPWQTGPQRAAALDSRCAFGALRTARSTRLSPIQWSPQ
jgi:hypothetical protein